MHDYIIIGSGIAGLYTALQAAKHGCVLMLTKAALEESNTRYAQGGIAAAIAPDDSPELHFHDTLVAGAGLCDEEAVRILTEEAPARIRDLLSYHVPFDRDNGELALGLEGAHSARRILHAGGDATGWHIEKALCDALRKTGATVIEGAFVSELALEHGRVIGAWVLDDSGEHRLYHGKHVILASGGAGQLFAYTTNPAVATGDGMALAFRAGAELADLEFYQFHPTALRLPGLPTFLVSEAARGEGAYLRNSAGERFMSRYDERGELAPRDVVSRAIASEMRCDGSEHVYLDMRHLDAEHVHHRFPTIAAFCAKAGLNIACDLLPVAPAAHYMMGGVRTNIWGETSVPGLYACGEVACTGVHGANRLASNSLLEGLVFGARIVQRSLQRAEWPETTERGSSDTRLTLAEPAPGPNHMVPTREAIQELMWRHVGLERTSEGLEHAISTLGTWLAMLHHPHSSAEHELRNLAQLGWLMACCAYARHESRGGHFRTDYPSTKASWQHRIVVQAEAAARETLVESSEMTIS